MAKKYLKNDVIQKNDIKRLKTKKPKSTPLQGNDGNLFSLSLLAIFKCCFQGLKKTLQKYSFFI